MQIKLSKYPSVYLALHLNFDLTYYLGQGNLPLCLKRNYST